MRKDHSLYKTPVIPDGHPYEDIFSFQPELQKLVAFSTAMKLPRHRWFYYKPGFAPDIVEMILKKYSRYEGESFLDPFSGVGTAPMVASKMGFSRSTGLDISPLGITIGSSKVLSLDKQDVLESLDKLKISPYRKKIEQYYLNKAYKKEIVRKLLSLRDSISSVEGTKETKQFLNLCLLSIADKFADVKKDGGFLRYFEREKPESILDYYRKVVIDFAEDFTKLTFESVPEFILADARKIPFDDGSIDTVITSPPYLNRYDYTRIYALELAMLGISDEEVRSIRKKTLKSHIEAKHQICPDFSSKIFDTIESDLPQQELSNPKIPEMVIGYFHDMAWNLKEVARVLRPNGFAAYVVGNCRFSGIHVEVDAILGQIAESYGLTVETILIAKTRGSSAQQVRKYGDLPLRESIVILRKN